MLKLAPILSKKIWGYELWLASTHFNGLQENLKNFCGGFHPLLIKIIQAHETLSVQVHPDDNMAQKLEGKDNRGKTECWYVLNAEPGAKLVYGLKQNYSLNEVKEAIQQNKLEEFLNYIEVNKGDLIFIPSGTVHAIGGGLRLLEVQQSCDLTYRLYDYGRGRELHIEKGLQCIKQNVKKEITPFNKNFECEYFCMEELCVNGSYEMTCIGQKENPSSTIFFFVLQGEGKIQSTDVILDVTTQATLKAEDIFAVRPNERITIEGKTRIIKISAK